MAAGAEPPGGLQGRAIAGTRNAVGRLRGTRQCRGVGAEVMLCTPAVRNIIREARTFEIPNVIDTNRQLGMISLDNAIAQLYFNSMISREDAITQAAYPDKLERQLAA